MVTKRTLANHKTIKIWGVGIGAGMLSVLLKQAQKEEPLDGRRVPMSMTNQQLNYEREARLGRMSAYQHERFWRSVHSR